MPALTPRFDRSASTWLPFALLAPLAACGGLDGPCPTSDEAPPGQAESSLPLRAPRGEPDVSDCTSCQAANLTLPDGALGTKYVLGAGDRPSLTFDVAMAVGSATSRRESRLWAIVDGTPLPGASVDLPSMAAGERWSGRLAIPVGDLAKGSHQVTIVPLETKLDDPYPTWAFELVKGETSALPRPLLTEVTPVEPVNSFGSGVFPTEQMLAAGVWNRPLSAASTPLTLPAANGDLNLRLLFRTRNSNCPKPVDRQRLVAFLDKEPLTLRGAASLDIVVPNGKQAELNLELHGLPTVGQHSLEFWELPAPDRHLVTDIATEMPNVWDDFTRRHSILVWNVPKMEARVIPGHRTASAVNCDRATPRH